MKKKILEISEKLEGNEITVQEAKEQFLFLFNVSNSKKSLAEEFKEYTDNLLKSEKKTKQFLIDAGINDENGNLTERYK